MLSAAAPTIKDTGVTRKPTPVGFKPNSSHIEDVTVLRSDTQASAFIFDKVPVIIRHDATSDTDRPGFAKRKPARFAAARMRFDRIAPRHKRYCFGRLSRKPFLIIIGVLLMCLLVLVVALAVGLSSRSHNNNENLPLPSNNGTFTGDLTYYAPGLGACGVTSTSEENIVAISHFTFDKVQVGSNPNSNPLCGRKIRATRFNEVVGEQRSIDLTVVDRCEACQPTDIDVTTTAFAQLADLSRGRIKMV